ncbi:MAG: asparagine--tRNA ligase [Marteilia pararefringens]
MNMDLRKHPGFCLLGEIENFKTKRHQESNTVQIEGWIESIRSFGKNLTFLILRHSQIRLQCIASNISDDYLQEETFIRLEGKFRPVSKGHTSPHMIEFHISSILNQSNGLKTPSNQPTSSMDLMLEMRRNSLHYNMTRTYNVLVRAFEDILNDLNFLKVSPPILTNTIFEEGESQSLSVSKLNEIDQTQYLSQSAQLYLEYCLPAYGKVYSISRCFRQENCSSHQHLKEFNHLEVELFTDSLEDLMTFAVELLRTASVRLSETPLLEEFPSDLASKIRSNCAFFKELEDYTILSYQDALDILISNDAISSDIATSNNLPPKITKMHENYLLDFFGKQKPLILTRFPSQYKPFYAKNCLNSNGDRSIANSYIPTSSFDLILPNIGELIGGSLRISDFKNSQDISERCGSMPLNCQWYFDSMKQGQAEHGGFGLGLDRLLMFLFGLNQIKTTNLLGNL